MHISSVEFGSFLAYSPRGHSEVQSNSRTVMRKLKNDEFLESQQILMSDYVAEGIRKNMSKLSFADFFTSNTILVPTPNSSLAKKDTLWVPHRIAEALIRKGLGKNVVPCLRRVVPLRKSATSLAADRPRAAEHYESMVVDKMLFEPDEILLIDDVITRGATLLGAANKLADAFPKTHIRAFAVMRTISTPEDFTRIIDPSKGTISLVGSETFRDP